MILESGSFSEPTAKLGRKGPELARGFCICVNHKLFDLTYMYVSMQRPVWLKFLNSNSFTICNVASEQIDRYFHLVFLTELTFWSNVTRINVSFFSFSKHDWKYFPVQRRTVRSATAMKVVFGLKVLLPWKRMPQTKLQQVDLMNYNLIHLLRYVVVYTDACAFTAS